jgi:hypothetical protein
MERLDTFEYGQHFRVSLAETEGGFTAWIERLDRGLISSGYSLAPAVGTHEYGSADAAIAAAKTAIDVGEVRLQP